MIGPKIYKEQVKSYSIPELKKERRRIQKFIDDYNSQKINKNDDIMTNPSSDVISKVYKQYLIQLDILISSKENSNNAYTCLDKIDDMKLLLTNNSNFFVASFNHVYKDDNKIKLEINYLETKYIFTLKNILSLDFEFYSNDETIDEIKLEYDSNTGIYDLRIEDDFFYIRAKELTISYLDKEKLKYEYVSVKYNDNNDKTFYYIADEDNYKIGDYVEVPVRDTTKIAVITDIKIYSYHDAPFPVSSTRHITRLANKEEFDRDSVSGRLNEIINTYKNTDVESQKMNFDFNNEDTLYERANKLPILVTQKIEWKQVDDQFPFPNYGDDVFKWIDEFYKLDLLDKNYMKNYKIFKNKKIEELSVEELLDFLSYLIRGERFCDGLIAGNLENGNIEHIGKCLKEKTNRSK